MYTYKHIVLYIFKLSLILTSFFTNTLLCLGLASRKVEPKLGLEIGSFVKYMNINKLFP